MEQNPISYLQEYQVKRHIIPEYIIIESRNGTNHNWFKMRVRCGQKFADGDGSSKKEAKYNAAKAMINLLGISSTDQLSSTNTTNIKNYNIVENISSVSHINYVGKLQEIAQSRDKVLPEYIDKPPTGPCHQLTFTTVCKFMGFEEEASGSSKKECKLLVSKKMLERINSNGTVCNTQVGLNNLMEANNENMFKLKIHEKNEDAMSESAAKALKLYLPLSKVKSSKPVHLKDKRSYNDNYTFLRDAFPYRVRELVIDKLQSAIIACENGINTDEYLTPMALLKLALEELKIEVKEVDHYKTQDKSCIYGLQLTTNPVISEVGHGKTKSSAMIQCILQMAVTISILIT